MSTEDTVERFKKYVEQIAPDGDLEKLIPEPSALEGFESGEISLATHALEKLGRDEPPDFAESAAFEAIIRPKTRPIADVINDSFAKPAAPWEHYDEVDIRSRLEAAIPSVGRIDVPELDIPYAGTGFVVGDDLLMTNHHVAKFFAAGIGVHKMRFTHSASVNFLGEKNLLGSTLFDLVEVVMIHPFWDMALLRIAGLENVSALALSHRSPEDLQNEDIAVIGYPAKDPRNNVDIQDRIFGGIYNIKRLQPGKLWEQRTISSFHHAVEAVTHDCSTLGGNSGSAVVLADSGEVAALHFAGRFRDANYAVPCYELARDARVVDAGVNFTGAVPPTNEWDDAWGGVTRAQRKPAVYRASELQHPVEDEDMASLPVTGSIQSSTDGQSMMLTIPLSSQPVHITVSVGDRATALSPQHSVPLVAADTEAAHKIAPDPDRASRPGYQNDFLGRSHIVPVPYLSENLYANVAMNSTADDDPHLLNYYHFSVCMSKSRCLAYFTAVNMDGHKEVDIRRGSDQWFLDPRISGDFQLTSGAYAGTPFDRGHLVRRVDPVWGSDFDEARLAHDDTFHWTNCSPQHAKFNRNRKTWALVENHILRRTNEDNRKVSVFTGPVFLDDDPIIITPADMEVQLPLQFWKVVVCVNEDDGLAASGFLISQEEIVNAWLNSLEFPVTDDVKPFQVSIAEIEELTDLSFGELADRDTLMANTESMAIGRHRIDTLDDIV